MPYIASMPYLTRRVVNLSFPLSSKPVSPFAGRGQTMKKKNYRNWCVSAELPLARVQVIVGAGLQDRGGSVIRNSHRLLHCNTRAGVLGRG